MKSKPPDRALFGRCTRGHRARLVFFDQAGRHQEPFVQMFAVGSAAGGANVYRVTCPTCGEQYTATASGAETGDS